MFGRKRQGRQEIISSVATVFRNAVSQGRSMLAPDASTHEAFNMGMITASSIVRAYAEIHSNGSQKDKLIGVSEILMAAIGADPDV